MVKKCAVQGFPSMESLETVEKQVTTLMEALAHLTCDQSVLISRPFQWHLMSCPKVSQECSLVSPRDAV